MMAGGKTSVGAQTRSLGPAKGDDDMKLRLTHFTAAAFALAVAVATFVATNPALACDKYTGV